MFTLIRNQVIFEAHGAIQAVLSTPEMSVRFTFCKSRLSFEEPRSLSMIVCFRRGLPCLKKKKGGGGGCLGVG